MTSKLQHYLIRINTPDGRIDREVKEYGINGDDARKRVAEKWQIHISSTVLIGEL